MFQVFILVDNLSVSMKMSSHKDLVVLPKLKSVSPSLRQ